MDFRFYTNAISQASQKLGAGVFITGMLLIGFGFLIWVLRELFAMLFAVLFCIAGIGCIVTAVKIFCAGRKIGKSGEAEEYRENVTIHTRDDFD